MFIHLYFMFFDHTPKAMILHAEPLVLIAVIVGGFSLCISLFNFLMFAQNEFDPIIIEKELAKRRKIHHNFGSDVQKSNLRQLSGIDSDRRNK